MTNKYLEKIAGWMSTMKTLGAGVKYLASTVGQGAGTMIHNATGGAYRTYAYRNLGVTDPKTLSRIGSSFQGRRAFIQSARKFQQANPSVKGVSGVKPVSFKKMAPGVAGDLKTKTVSGKIGTGLMAGGAYIGAGKLINKIKQNQAQNQYNQQYYQ